MSNEKINETENTEETAQIETSEAEAVGTEKTESEPEKKPKKKRNIKAIILLVAIILMAIGAAIYFVITYIMPMGTYNSAHDYAERGELDKAIEYYKELGNYRDSKELYYKYLEEYARELVFNDKDYEGAEKLLCDVYTEDDDIIMLLGYARSAIYVKKAEEGDSEAVNHIKEMVMDDYVSGVYSYAEVCVSNKDYTKAKILLDALMERSYRDTEGLYNTLLESDPVARAKTLSGYKEYATAFLDVLTNENISLVKFVDENNDGLDEMLVLDKEDNLKTISYTGKAEETENSKNPLDKDSFISKVKAVGILEDKLISGLKGSEDCDVTESVIDQNKLQMQNMIDYDRNKSADGKMWVNSHIKKIYELKDGVYYVKYTYAMKFGTVTLPSDELRNGDFTGGEYLQKYENDLNEMYGYAIFGLNKEGESKYYLGECSTEDEEYIDHTRIKGLME